MKCHLCEDRGCYREGKVCVESSNNLLLPEEEMKILKTASLIEKEFYCKMTRIEEIVEFSKRMGYKRIGIAFCIGLFDEAKIVADIFSKKGFEVFSAVCKLGSVDKDIFNLPKLQDGKEAICNPVKQAEVLNKKKTDLNIIIGLCVGHDILFQKYSEAPSTVLIVKDRVLAHNPVGALHTPYHLRRILEDK
ncbi:DUF1847 domain-containing protein [Desulfurobacterium atlanticum]|uniref:Uncharacterized metal-binding protein n=1 Tax=Desulfurobacterium atlanticum TaxID=240169 RepID=A0A238YHG1_9BACT|nr:DUF1847 domain-containing protein [Desulfurobacterium atlanticum]SNR70567.1 Uncharacterized metal-binding protein [Desulfurobacterium atlanticum]